MLRVAPGATNLLRPWLLGASLLALVFAGSCVRELDDPPPPAGGCTLEECVEPVDMPPTGSLGGASGAAGMGGSGGDEEPVTLEGTVRFVTSADLVQDSPLPAPVNVLARDFNGVLRSVTTAADGDFLLDDVAARSDLEVRVVAQDDDLSGDVLDTLQIVDTTVSTPVTLDVLSRTMFDDLIDVSFVTTPTAFDERSGSAIVFVQDESGAPLDGASVVLSNDVLQIAYDDGAVYSDALEQTGGRGAFVLLNVQRTRIEPLLIQYAQGTHASSLDFEPGTVTVRTIRISP
jgi:hypothetical protein